MKHKPNTVLPEGAELITPKRMTIGGWSEMTYDAKVTRFGVTWYRVKGGFGERGDREDWVAKLSAHSVSVSDYHWNGEEFGPSYGSFDQAVIEQSKYALECAYVRVDRLRFELQLAERGLSELENTVSEMEATA